MRTAQKGFAAVLAAVLVATAVLLGGCCTCEQRPMFETVVSETCRPIPCEPPPAAPPCVVIRRCP